MASRALVVGTFVVLLLGTAVPGPTPASHANTGAVDSGKTVSPENLEKISSLSEERAPGRPTPETTPSDGEASRSEEVERANPWGEREVTVAVRSKGRNASATQRAAVTAATKYWNDNHDAYSAYDIEFTVVTNADRADVVVEFVPYIDTCGGLDSGAITLACAPKYESGEAADVPTTVKVREDRPREALADSVKHEFGHLLGIGHGEAPMPLMQERARFEPRTAVRNASERTYPWYDTVLTVAVVHDTTYDSGALRAHLREALDYYERGPPDWDRPTPTFRIVSDPTQADIVLQVTREDACDVGGGYCWSVTGEQLDRDAAIEYYTRFEATFGGVDPQYFSWYAGRAIGFALGAEAESQLPSTFVHPENADSEWFDAEVQTPYPDGKLAKLQNRTAVATEPIGPAR